MVPVWIGLCAAGTGCHTGQAVLHGLDRDVLLAADTLERWTDAVPAVDRLPARGSGSTPGHKLKRFWLGRPESPQEQMAAAHLGW